MHNFNMQASRRSFLRDGATGVGAIALSSMLQEDLLGKPAQGEDKKWEGVARPLHIPARAKRVIFLCMAGGPSHLETFDYKPKLAEMSGKPMPESFTKGQPIAQLQGKQLTCLAPQHPFGRHGESGQEISSIFQHLPKIADDMCIIRSMKTEQILSLIHI